MARNSARPGRTVAVFFIVLAIAYGLVALVGTWKPALGLDLEGGTQITLIADGSVSKDNLNQAADIIDARVNGSGVSEAEVTTQGSNEIVVQVPGTTQSSLVETVDPPGPAALPAGRAGARQHDTTDARRSPAPSPSVGVDPPPSPNAKPKVEQAEGKPTGKNRTPALLGQDKAHQEATDHEGPSPSPTTTPSRRNVPDLHVGGELHRGQQEGASATP